MTRRPPPLANRLLTWSLAAADRDAVLGDLQEEFAALASQSGGGAAARWYWAQTLTSVGPNVVRRIRTERQQRRVNESDSDRLMRKSVRTFSLWMIGVPIALGILVWGDSQYLLLVVGCGAPTAFVGLLLLLITLSPRRTTDSLTTKCQLRRGRLFLTFWVVANVPQLFANSDYRPFFHGLNGAKLAVGAAILFWPKRYWPIKPRNVSQASL